MGASDELEHLREAERRLSTITAQAPDFILEFDRAGIISYMNRPAPGHTMADMLGTDVRRWMEPAAHAAFDRALGEVFTTRQLASYESVGSVTGRHYVNRISPVLVDGQVQSAILITHDVTEIKQAQQQARESEARYRALVEASFEGIAISVDRVLLDGNQALAEMFGYALEEMIGLTPADLATPESAALIARNVEAGMEAAYEVTCIRRSGARFPCELLGRNTVHQGRPARITGFRDLTERRRREAEQERREERVRHAQKLETLGVLAGGIAHDFNNLLAIVLANADCARRKLAHDPAAAERHLALVDTAVARATDLTDQLLVYAGRGERQTGRIDLSELVRDATELLRVSISKKAELRCELAAELPATSGDLGQLRQVAVNLILNASEALGGAPGRITLSTGLIEADAATLARTLAADAIAPGSYVVLRVADSGLGMDAATLGRIFDPFFSSKSAGRGLGLAAVRGIVRAHGGAIEVDSAPGQGTRVSILLPVAEGDAPAPPTAPAPAPRATPTQGTVLLAEDEAAIARVVGEALREAGCRVLTAADGEQAIALFAEHAGEIDVLLLDLTMPRKNGLEALAAIRELDGRVPAILTSGYSADGYQDVLARDPGVSFLAKPYTIDDLLAHLWTRLPGAAAE